MRRITPKGLVYTIDLTKIADRDNPRTVEALVYSNANGKAYSNGAIIDWGDGESDSIEPSQSAFVSHTYADGAGDVFTVVIRSADGHLPCPTIHESYSTGTDYNRIYAVVSIDHYAGACWQGNFYAHHAPNLKYCATRISGMEWRNSLFNMFEASAEIEQPIESFCFDFCVASAANTFLRIFSDCSKLYGSPKNTFTRNNGARSFQLTFNNCPNLTGEPFVFWKEDGSLDTDKFPNLANTGQCYTGCSDALRAQVPTAYGGTMTVG